MQTCPNCGHENSSYEKKCVECGILLPTTTVNKYRESEDDPVLQQEDVPSSDDYDPLYDDSIPDTSSDDSVDFGGGDGGGAGASDEW